MPTRSRAVRLVAAVAAAAALAACSAQAHASSGREVKAKGVSRVDPGPISTTPLANGISAFGYDLYNTTPRGANGNVVFSPFSIAVAMSMARDGAHGATASEIDKALHFPTTDRDAEMNALLLSLQNANSPMSVADQLFVADRAHIGQPFLKTLAANYGAGVRTVDFSGSGAAKQINAWVKQQTGGKIDKLFDKIPTSTKLVLANAVYLKADWSKSFKASDTGAETFTRADDSTVEATMMHEKDDFRYASEPGWQAIELPYSGGGLAMVVLLPTGDTAPGALLSPATLEAAHADMTETTVDLSLPEWDFSTNLDLVPALKALGVKAAVAPGADFSGIAPSLYIAAAVHRATITVTEKGTKAAAVTGLDMATTAMPGEIDETTTMDVDHPFAFAIVQQITGAIVFEGTVGDPTAS